MLAECSLIAVESSLMLAECSRIVVESSAIALGCLGIVAECWEMTNEWSVNKMLRREEEN